MTTTKRLYMDVHILQTVPPSCINRDDTGAPKTAIYGGVQRARVSSQAWKRAVRNEFQNLFEQGALGYRTKKVAQLLAEAIRKQNSDIDEKKSIKLAEEALNNAGVSMKKSKQKDSADEQAPDADALLLVSDSQIKALAELAAQGSKEKALYKKALKENPSVDLALFGRMLASDPSLNWDAACQVAHAISTHGVSTEFDYFTAVDDMAPADNAGAGHIGISEFNSSTLYRYATVNLMELYSSLGLKAAEAAAGFLRAFALSMPTGKQNSFANRTIPCLVYVTIREDQPVSFAGAFEKAVPRTESGYEGPSCKALGEYAETLYDAFVEKPEIEYVSGTKVETLPEPVSFKNMVNEVKEQLEKLLSSSDH